MLEVDNPRYHLVGGPTAGCQRLTDGGFVEIMPSGLRIWGTRNGALVAGHGRLFGALADAVAFAPRGARYAICGVDPFHDERVGQLLVRALPSDQDVLRRDDVHLAQVDSLHPAHHVPGIAIEAFPRHALGFSPDGELLWWETPDGERWVLPIAPLRERAPSPTVSPHRVSPSPPSSPSATACSRWATPRFRATTSTSWSRPTARPSPIARTTTGSRMLELAERW